MAFEECTPVNVTADEQGREFPTYLQAGFADLTFDGWSAANGYATYKDQFGEQVKVFDNDGTLVAELRED